MNEHAINADVAIIGGGIAGLVAAVRAGQHGLRAVVLEKLVDERYICNSRLTGGIFHFANRSLFTEVDVLRNTITEATDGTAHPGLVDALTSDLLRTVRWLQSLGMRFIRASGADYQAFVLSPPAVPQVGRPWQGRSGDVLLPLLEGKLSAQHGRLLRGYRATELTIENGACTGVIGTDRDRTGFRVRAHAVVLADGGFQANPAELRAHVSPAPERLVQRNAGTGLGDGLRMAEAAGARLTERSKFYGHVLSRDALTNDKLWPYPWLDELVRSSIMIGADGRRFVDEGHGGVHVANQIAALADPAATSVIFDHAAWLGPGCERALSPNPYLQRIGGTVHSAPSLEALATLLALPGEVLIDEVTRFNAALAAGTLPGLIPPRTTTRFRAWPMLQSPFYAIPAAAGITYTMGGIAIDGYSRVLGENDRPIPGLYAAGSCTGGLEGGPRAGYAGGLCKASTTGLRAGEHIAEVLGARSVVH